MSERINFAYVRSTPQWDAHVLRSGQVLRLAVEQIPDLNRSGFGGDFWPWKRGWKHAE